MKLVKMAAAVCLCLLAGCTNGVTETLTVFAASSLNGYLPEDDDVTYSFAGSSSLARQIADGAPADVFVSANHRLAEAVAAEAGRTVVPFLTNRLVIITPPGNPAAISIERLADDDLLIAVCAIEVPCGETTAALPFEIKADTFEPSVRAVLTRVELDEVDAGIVFVTDAAIAGERVEAIEVPDNQNRWTSYSIVQLSDGPITDRYIAQLTGEITDKLVADGFGRPQ